MNQNFILLEIIILIYQCDKPIHSTCNFPLETYKN